MSENTPAAKSPYKFENDASGRLFCWCIESGAVDLSALIDGAFRDGGDSGEVIKRLASVLELAVAQHPDWAAEGPSPQSAALPGTPRKAPPYSIWFRPSPSKKVKFKEVAKSLLIFAGRIPAES
ncbi:MAG: hypothetical protein ABSG68_10750 [Thermoguttaceae bacterium]|jgi:hypothetical protein